MQASVRLGTMALLIGCHLTLPVAGQPAEVRPEGSRWILANRSIERAVETAPFLHTTSITNRLAEGGRRYALESRGFVLALDDEKLTLTASDFQLGKPESKQTKNDVRLVVPLRCQKHGVRVTATYRLAADAFYVRKHLQIDPGNHLLNWVDVESCRLKGVKLRRFDQDPIPFPHKPWDITVGRPLFGERDLFLGVEHPASINSFDQQGWISLRQYPGRRGKTVTAPSVIGVCPDRPRRRLVDYFQRYVDENRARPVKRIVQWDAYFSEDFDDDYCRRKFDVAERVFARRGAPIDVVVIDGGWTDPQSIMRVSRLRPDRLALIAKLAKERLGAKLGLHVITSGLRATADKDWMAAQGYDMIYHTSKSAGAYCFADPRAFSEFRDNLVGYVRDHGVASYTFDWGRFACPHDGHRGHIRGQKYGFEAGASNFIRVHKALRKLNPEIYLYNTGWYSPWWFWSFDAHFCAGADYNFGLDGPPAYATTTLITNWRDATIRGNFVRWSPYYPLNSLMTATPMSYWWHDWESRSESPLRPFTDDYVTTALRGTQMMTVYSNISAWDEDHADAAVAVLKWMKANDELILASTRYIGGDPLAREPYGYAHFNPQNRGIILVRNPTIEPRTMTVTFDETAGMWPGDGQYVIRTVYPHTRVHPQTVRYGSQLEQPLASHEVRVLEVWPIDALPEPMPVGCRYEVASREPGKTTFLLPAGREKLDLFSPLPLGAGTPAGGRPQRYTVAVTDPATGPAAVGDESQAALGWLQQKPATRDGAYVISISVPEKGSALVSFLFGQRGLGGTMMLDGKPIDAVAPHVRLPDADGREASLKRYYRGNKEGRGMRAKASDWSLFGATLGPGRHDLRLRPSATPKGDALVITDVRVDRPPVRTLQVSHGPLARSHEVLPPRNWSWEVRRVDSFALPPPVPSQR